MCTYLTTIYATDTNSEETCSGSLQCIDLAKGDRYMEIVWLHSHQSDQHIMRCSEYAGVPLHTSQISAIYLL